MSKNLYEEAIADAKKIREVAEENAKKAILEAVTPKIKEFIRLVHLECRTKKKKILYRSSNDYNLSRAGTGGSSLPNLPSEFSDVPHLRGTLSMARSSDPDSANSQFFICFEPAPFLDRQYTVFGKVIEGMEFVDKIKRGDSNNNGAVSDPDKIISFRSE